MYKLTTRNKKTYDLSIGFDRDRGRSQRELNKNQNRGGKNHVRAMLRVKFGFAEHQEKAIYSL